MRKASDPNSNRQTKLLNNPQSAGIWSFEESHCSVKVAIKSAVIENSIPAVEKGRTLPRMLPVMLSATQ